MWWQLRAAAVCPNQPGAAQQRLRRNSTKSTKMGGRHSRSAEPVAAASSVNPQIRCYQCRGLFTTSQPAGQRLHVRCPYCATINGMPSMENAHPTVNSFITAASAASTTLPPAAQARQEELLRRLQAREISPLELMILREFVEHLQHAARGEGASTDDIDNHTASWVVDDVEKLPQELRSCCVCLEDVQKGEQVRTLPCLHTFHDACAVEWLRKKKTCPLCQFAIDGAETTGEE